MGVGPKKIDTRVKPLKEGKVTFNEKFQMKTALDFDLVSNEFLSKPVSRILIMPVDDPAAVNCRVAEIPRRGNPGSR